MNYIDDLFYTKEHVWIKEMKVKLQSLVNPKSGHIDKLPDGVQDPLALAQLNIILKNIDIEKKTNYLEMKINSYDFNNMDKVKNPIAVNDVVNLNNYEHDEKRKKDLKKRYIE